MINRTRFRLIFTSIVLTAGLSATAIADLSESSALAPLSFFPYLLGAAFGGAHTPNVVGYVIGLVLEWWLIGYVLSAVIYLFVTPGPAQRNAEDKRDSVR